LHLDAMRSPSAPGGVIYWPDDHAAPGHLLHSPVIRVGSPACHEGHLVRSPALTGVMASCERWLNTTLLNQALAHWIGLEKRGRSDRGPLGGVGHNSGSDAPGRRPAVAFGTLPCAGMTRIGSEGVILSRGREALFFLWEVCSGPATPSDWPNLARISGLQSVRAAATTRWSPSCCRTPQQRAGRFLPRPAMPARPARLSAHQSREDFSAAHPRRCRRIGVAISERLPTEPRINLRFAQPGRRGCCSAPKPHSAITGEASRQARPARSDAVKLGQGMALRPATFAS